MNGIALDQTWPNWPAKNSLELALASFVPVPAFEVDFDTEVHVVDVVVYDADLVKELDVGCALAVLIFDSNCFKPATNE